MDTPHIDDLSPDQIAELQSLVDGQPSEEDLFRAIGRSLGAAASGEPPEERGRNAVRRLLGQVQKGICANAGVRSFCENANVIDSMQVVIAIAGGLVASKFDGVNPLLVACLVARVGVRRLCSGEWKP
jgi:hypothetical protein